MFIAADYPFLDLFWTMMIFFFWVIWIWLLIAIFADIFRRHDIGGGQKVLWTIFVIILPYLGVLVYMLANHDGMTERNVSQARRQAEALGGGSAAEIERAKRLLDQNAISQTEYETIKAQALGA